MPPPMLSVNRRTSLHEVGNRFNMASPQQRAKSASPSNKRRIVPVTLNISADGFKPPAPASAPAAPSPPPSHKGKERETPSSASGTPKGTPKAKPSANGHTTPNGTPNGRHRAGNGTPNGSAKKVMANGHASTPKGVPNGTPNGTAQHTPASTGKKDKERGPKKAAGAGAVDMSWPQELRSRSPAGLINGSMACYVNATMQVILHTPPVLKVALGHDQEDCLLHGRSKFCMLCALRQMATSEHFSGKRSYRPSMVHNHLGQIKKGFSKHRQEDTHEFFRFVTDALQNTALAGKPKDLPEKVKHSTWVYKIWGGKVRSRVLCLSCRKPSDTFDSILDLSLDISTRSKNASLTVEQLLDNYIKEDRLDGDNKYNCESCKRKSAATKSMRIAQSPPVLTFHLKRFGFSLTSWSTKATKVNNMIDYKPTLDMSKYMTEPGSGTKYRLFAVTCHHGSSLHYGHYTSYVKGSDGSWFECDDESVRPVRPSEVLQDRSAYLLSYMRVDDAAGGPPSTPATPVAPVSHKRQREEDSPSPNKRPNGVGKPNGVAKKAEAPALARLNQQYGSSSSSSSEDEDAKPKAKAAKAKPAAQLPTPPKTSPPATARPSTPPLSKAVKAVTASPRSPRSPKAKRAPHSPRKHKHRPSHRREIIGGKHGAPMPFKQGSFGKSNLRSQRKSHSRIGRMKGRHES